MSSGCPIHSLAATNTYTNLKDWGREVERILAKEKAKSKRSTVHSPYVEQLPLGCGWVTSY